MNVPTHSHVDRDVGYLPEEPKDTSPVSGDVLESPFARETRRELNETDPVQRDQQYIENPIQPPYANSDEPLEQDENEALRTSNILRSGRLHHETPQT